MCFQVQFCLSRRDHWLCVRWYCLASDMWNRTYITNTGQWHSFIWWSCTVFYPVPAFLGQRGQCKTIWHIFEKSVTPSLYMYIQIVILCIKIVILWHWNRNRINRIHGSWHKISGLGLDRQEMDHFLVCLTKQTSYVILRTMYFLYTVQVHEILYTVVYTQWCTHSGSGLLCL